MSEVLSTLTGELEPEMRIRISERVNTMRRQLQYMLDAEDASITYVQSRGWELQRLIVVCELNSFYQAVLGPLASSARERCGSLGEDLAVLYGSLRFDKNRARRVRAAHIGFMAIVAELEIPQELLTANHSADMVYQLSNNLRQNG